MGILLHVAWGVALGCLDDIWQGRRGGWRHSGGYWRVDPTVGYLPPTPRAGLRLLRLAQASARQLCSVGWGGVVAPSRLGATNLAILLARCCCGMVEAAGAVAPDFVLAASARGWCVCLDVLGRGTL